MVKIISTEFLDGDDPTRYEEFNSDYSSDFEVSDEHFEDYLDNTTPSQRKKPLQLSHKKYIPKPEEPNK